jgi:hypothetical protein
VPDIGLSVCQIETVSHKASIAFLSCKAFRKFSTDAPGCGLCRSHTIRIPAIPRMGVLQSAKGGQDSEIGYLAFAISAGRPRGEDGSFLRCCRRQVDLLTALPRADMVRRSTPVLCYLILKVLDLEVYCTLVSLICTIV